MANCGCQGTKETSTQEDLVAWIQPSGPGPLNPYFYAMSDSDEYPGLKISGTRKNRRGTITPIYDRSGRNPRNTVRVGSRRGTPAANTITLELATRGCGGFHPTELISCLLTTYTYHLCCQDGGDFLAGWSKIEAHVDIDIESDEYSDGVSYVPDDNNRQFIRHTGEFREKYTWYPLTTDEIAIATGFDTGAAVTDVIYANREQCGGCSGLEQSCTDQWYAATNEGRIIYKGCKTCDATSVAIPSFPASQNTFLGLLGSRLFVSFTDTGSSLSGYFYATLDQQGDPGTWTRVDVVSLNTLQPTGFLNVGNHLWLFGESSTNPQARVYRISSDTSNESLFASAVNNTGFQDVAECGGNAVAVGRDGTIMLYSKCSNAFSFAPSTPSAATWLTIGIRVDGEWWIGNSQSQVYYSLDGGESWTLKSIGLNGTGNVVAIRWANANTGYIVHNDPDNGLVVYSTWNGGRDWTREDPRIDVQPVDGSQGRQIAVPCCTNAVEQSNNFLLAGLTASAGGLWQGSIQRC